MPPSPLLSSAEPLAFLAAMSSRLSATRSANPSATSTARRKHASARKSQTWRQQAQPNNLILRSLALPNRDLSMLGGSSQASHSDSVMLGASIVVRGPEEVPVADDVRAMVSRPAERRPL